MVGRVVVEDEVAMAGEGFVITSCIKRTHMKCYDTCMSYMHTLTVAFVFLTFGPFGLALMILFVMMTFLFCCCTELSRACITYTTEQHELSV